MNDTPFFMEHLGLRPDADERAIRRAYATLLKKIDQEADPAAFQSLREAYDNALLWVRHDNQTGHEATIAAPAPTPAEDDPSTLASAMFAEFLQHMPALPADDDALWQQALQQSLDDERLIGISTRELFEHHIAALLAGGWQPGHEALLVAAVKVFGWGDDRRRLRSLGEAGMMLDAAIDERATFDLQAADVRYDQRQLIARLRDDTPPTTRQLMEGLPLLEQLIARFPTWLAMVASAPLIMQWRASHAQLSKWRKLPFRAERAASKAVRGRIGLLIWAIFIGMMVLGSLFSPGEKAKPQVADTAADYARRGATALDQHNLTDAIDNLTRSLRLSKDADNYGLRAIAYAWNGQLELAQQDIDQSAALNSASPMLFRARGTLAGKRKQYAEAVDAFSLSLQLDPNHVFTLLQRSFAYFELHNYPQVLADTGQVLKLDPSIGMAYSLRLDVAWMQKDKAAAMKEIERMLAARPDSSYAHHVAAFSYTQWGMRPEAIAVLTRGIERAPSANLYLYRAQLRPSAELAQRRSDLAKALSLEPQSFSIARDSAELEIGTAHFSDAQPILTSALNKAALSKSQRSTLLGLRGIAYTQTGAAALAQSDYNAARALVDNETGLNNLCWLLATHDTSLDLALSLCDASLAKAPDDAAALDSRGMVLLRMGRYQEAIASYDAALAKRPGYYTSLYGRGLARHKLGAHANGNADLKAARAIDDGVDEEFRNMGLKAG
ncbi:tetratricopeptide repeat protein [Pseudoduganella sp. FT26W]|uniref:Tetratricopeptide repeat protein n=1 Tax=Duganella aquatilis TaxID=2666082 RepID=A0A844DBZ2_9BURK|nr:J domain-containing protein [Duganella aquatilis]MRW85916.1 tetratricopeptide repeat protein [Duganella aquatilis]